MTLRALIFGAAGQAGRAVAAAAPAGATVTARSFAEVDIRDAAAVRAAVADAKPDVIFNCAAFTKVDDAEIHPAQAMAVNADGPAVIAAVARDAGARLVHLSTDYVFNGRGGAPYAIEDAPDPESVYGTTKLEGERRLLAICPDASIIIRTAWLHSGRGTNFVATTIRVLTGGSSMQVVDDQIGTPTRAANLANAMWQVAHRPGLCGVLHFTDAGVASWFDVAVCIAEALRAADRIGDDIRITPVDTARFPRPARRPRCAVLDKHVTWQRLEWTPPHWRAGVIASTREILDA